SGYYPVVPRRSVVAESTGGPTVLRGMGIPPISCNGKALLFGERQNAETPSTGPALQLRATAN
ncbi:MAG TPA: hypothetical protein VHP35_04795, partial [Terriglobia bacterium]|nr:hypothetical protein [Terriglobia bacterium]